MNPLMVVAIGEVTLMLLDWIAEERTLPKKIDDGRTRLRRMLVEMAREEGSDEVGSQDH